MTINSCWHSAAYHTEKTKAYYLTEKPEYPAFSEAWVMHHEWKRC